MAQFRFRRPGPGGHKAQDVIARFILPQFVVRQTDRVRKTFIHLPRRHAPAIPGGQRIAGAAVNHIPVSVGQHLFFRKIADAIPQQGHINVRQRRDDQIADALRAGVHDFEERRVVAGFHFAAPAQ